MANIVVLVPIVSVSAITAVLLTNKCLDRFME